MEALLERRSAAVGAFARIETYINRIKNKGISELEIQDIHTRKDWLSEAFIKYNEAQDKIDYLVLSKNYEDDDEDRDEVENKYCYLMTELKNKLQLFHSANSVDFDSESLKKSRDINVKLPELNINTFDGNIAEWTSFFELFTALILKNSNLSDIQRFLYLKSYLKGEPLNLINNLPLNSDNFKIAINTLKDRYENKLLIINAHIKKILETTSVMKCSANNLREFITKVKQNLESLRLMKMPVDEWGLLLIYILSQKLDFNTRKSFEIERKRDELPTLTELFLFLERRCSILECLSVPDMNISKIKNSKIVHHVNNHISPGRLEKGTCFYCNMLNHNIYRCLKFKKISLPERKQFVDKKRLCFNCVGSKHSTNNCTSGGCSVCQGRHHTMLHNYSNKLFLKSELSDPSSITGPHKPQYREMDIISSPHSTPSNSESKIGDIVSHYSRSIDNNLHILLATVSIRVSLGNGKFRIVKALLDPGSQSSFITTELSQQLHQKLYFKNSKFSGISNNTTISNKAIDLTIYSLTNEEHLDISCSVLNNITSYLPQLRIKISELNLPQEITLADPTFHIPSKIDILLGCDIYYGIILPEVIKLGKNRPSLQNTLFGWIVMGPTPFSSFAGAHVSQKIASFTKKEEFRLDLLLKRFWKIEDVETRYN